VDQGNIGAETFSLISGFEGHNFRNRAPPNIVKKQVNTNRYLNALPPESWLELAQIGPFLILAGTILGTIPGRKN